MSKKLNFNENDIFNAVWSGLDALSKKPKKDATDVNALARATDSMTRFGDMKLRWQKYVDKNPKSLSKATLFLS